MNIPAHGLPLVKSSEIVIVSTFNGKMGVITCQERCGTCTHSVVVIKPNVIVYIDGGQPRVVCTPCAESATALGKLSARSDIEMSPKKLSVWINRHGFAPSGKCHLCDQGITIHGDWECLHAAAEEIEEDWELLFTAHAKCNEMFKAFKIARKSLTEDSRLSTATSACLFE